MSSKTALFRATLLFHEKSLPHAQHQTQMSRGINIRSMSQCRKMTIALYNMDMMRTTPMSTMMRTMHQKRPFLGPQLYFMIKSLLPFNAWYKKTYSGLLVY
jgi:hypothetical protein